MFFIVAPPSAGKGNAKIGPELIEDINFQASYDLECNNVGQSLIIPGNISSAALIDQLDINNGRGFIFESEADTISNIIEKEWGGFSDILRKGFHHETITCKRKDKSLVKIKEPKISMLLTGTPNQVIPFVGSIENGLFSRFSFYYFDVDPIWKSANPKFVQEESKKLIELKNKIELFWELISPNSYEITLSDELWEIHSKFFSAKMTNNNAHIENSPFASVIRRLGLVSVRIAMILEIFDLLGTSEMNGASIACKQKNLETALQICDVLFQNDMEIAQYISKQNEGFIPITPQDRLFEILPKNQFLRKEAVSIGKGINLSERSIDSYLKNLIATGLLEKLKAGFYKKTIQS